jgi:hypothetical protein
MVEVKENPKEEIKEEEGETYLVFMKDWPVKLLQEDDIQMKDIFGMEGFTFNLTWVQIQRLVNRAAGGKKVLKMTNSAMEHFEMFQTFLVKRQ